MNERNTHSSRSLVIQIAAMVCFWLLLVTLIGQNVLEFDNKINFTFLVGIPAVVIGVAQLVKNTKMERAAHIRDYAIKFHSDKDLSESFHYLVLRYGNDYYDLYLKTQRSEMESQKLDAAQAGIAEDLRFYDPSALQGTPQERRLDNLLGFFDTLAYDYRRGLISLADVSNVFGIVLTHFAQRKVITGYLAHVKESWGKAPSFQQISAPVPYNYLRLLILHYRQYCERRGKAEMARLERELG